MIKTNTFTIDFDHWADDSIKPQFKMKTFCRITMGNKIREGQARCSFSDNFCRAKGRKIALTRAISDFPKEIRKIIWDEYFKVCKKD